MNVGTCPYSIVRSQWRNYDITLWLCDKLSDITATSQLRRSNVDKSYLYDITLWPICESHCCQILSYIVTRLWIWWCLWRLWCEVCNLVSPESQPLEHQAWRSRAWARILTSNILFFNSHWTGPRLKNLLFIWATFLICQARFGPCFDLITVATPG